MCGRYYRQSDKRAIACDAARPPVDLLRPYPAEEVIDWKVGAAVGNARNDSPELLAAQEPQLC